MDHIRHNCSNKIRCKSCLVSGHVSRQCWKYKRATCPNEVWVWRRKSTQPHIVSAEVIDSCTESRDESLPSKTPVESNLLTDPPPQTNAVENPNTVPNLVLDGESDEEQAAMANFPVDPTPYLVTDLTIEHGWNRPARGHVALGGEPTQEHEDYAIVTIKPMLAEANQLGPTLTQVVHFLEDTQRVRVETAHISPLGLGLIRLHSVVQRDKLVRSTPMNFWG